MVRIERARTLCDSYALLHTCKVHNSTCSEGIQIEKKNKNKTSAGWERAGKEADEWWVDAHRQEWDGRQVRHASGEGIDRRGGEERHRRIPLREEGFGVLHLKKMAVEERRRLEWIDDKRYKGYIDLHRL